MFTVKYQSFYVQELALKLVMAQAELHNIEKDLLKRIIGHLLENVTVKVGYLCSYVLTLLFFLLLMMMEYSSNSFYRTEVSRLRLMIFRSMSF